LLQVKISPGFISAQFAIFSSLHTRVFLRNIRLTPLPEDLENTAEQPEKIAFYEIKAHPA
jgi:hypothetical protein